ncbi:MAG: hypothetical protein Q9220_003444 [cf. Caloplaca sp. 1 TL-2023]
MPRSPRYIANAVQVNLVRPAPPCLISNVYGKALQDDILEDIATTVAGLDTQFLGFYKATLQATGRDIVQKASDISAAVTFADTLQPFRLPQLDDATISGLFAQFEGIRSGEHRFHEHYLRDKFTLEIWKQDLRIISATLDIDPGKLGDNEFHTKIHRMFRIVGRLSASLVDDLAAAVARGVLDSDARAVLRLRILRLDQMFDVYHGKTDTPRTNKSWPEIRKIIDGKNDFKAQHPSDALPMQFIEFIYWCTIAASLMVSIPLLYKAYEHSPHRPGSTRDADFWLLVQNSVMQCLNLMTAGLLTIKDRSLQRAFRQAMLGVQLLGISCIISAVVLYTQVPTEWSAMLACVAPALEAFWLVHLLLAKKDKQD